MVDVGSSENSFDSTNSLISTNILNKAAPFKFTPPNISINHGLENNVGEQGTSSSTL